MYLPLLLIACICLQAQGKPHGEGLENIENGNTRRESILAEITYANRGMPDIYHKFHARKRRLAHPKVLWPKSKDGFVYVPYTIGAGTPTESLRIFEKAVVEFNKLTCIRFRPKNATDVDYVELLGTATGCWAHLGRQGGKQQVSIQVKACTKLGIGLHELMHVVGFDHTMARHDRNEHIEIKWANIRQAFVKNFDEHIYGEAFVFGEAYDIDSVLHYGSYDFAIDKDKPTIIYKADPTRVFGNRERWTDSDIKQINRVYKCLNYDL